MNRQPQQPYQPFPGQGYPYPQQPYATPYPQQPYTAQAGSWYQPRQPGQPEKPRRVPPMPRNQALALVEKCKRWIVFTSLMGFATLGALVLVNMPAQASQATPSSSSALPVPTATSDDNAGIFQQQQGGGGFGFGSNNQFQGPASRSSGS